MNPTTTYCQACGGILQQTYTMAATAATNTVVATTATAAVPMASSAFTNLVALPYQNFCSCHPVDVSPSMLSVLSMSSSPAPTHTMKRFVLEFEEFCDADDIWYPARQEGCVSSDGETFVFDYKLPIPANAEDQERRYEHFSSYKKMIAIYDRRPFIRDVQVHWIDPDA